MAILFMDGPTLVSNILEAMSSYSFLGNTAYVKLNSFGRGGKYSIMSGGSTTLGGFVKTTPRTMGETLADPFRFSCDIRVDSRLAGAGGVAVHFGPQNAMVGGANNGPSLAILSSGALQIRGSGGSTVLAAAPDGTLVRDTVHTVEVELAMPSTFTDHYMKVWVDNILVAEFSGARLNNITGAGVIWVRFESGFTANANWGIDYSNIIMSDVSGGMTFPLGPTEIVYVPVLDADLSKLVPDDEGPSKQITGTFQDFTMGDIDRPEDVLGTALLVRTRTGVVTPGILDIRVDDIPVGQIAPTTEWRNLQRVIPIDPTDISGSIVSLRNANT